MKVVFTNTGSEPQSSADVTAGVQRLPQLNLGFWDRTSSMIHVCFHHYWHFFTGRVPLTPSASASLQQAGAGMNDGRCLLPRHRLRPKPDHPPNPAGDALYLSKKGVCLDTRCSTGLRTPAGSSTQAVMETLASTVRRKSGNDETLESNFHVESSKRGNKRWITAHLAAACLQTTNEPLSSGFYCFCPSLSDLNCVCVSSQSDQNGNFMSPPKLKEELWENTDGDGGGHASVAGFSPFSAPDGLTNKLFFPIFV